MTSPVTPPVSPPMTPLESVFEQALPALMTRLGRRGPPTVYGFAATDGPEVGFWVVSFADGYARRATTADHPTVTVQADARVLTLMFQGGLDIEQAIARGFLVITGERRALEQLGELLKS